MAMWERKEGRENEDGLTVKQSVWHLIFGKQALDPPTNHSGAFDADSDNRFYPGLHVPFSSSAGWLCVCSLVQVYLCSGLSIRLQRMNTLDHRSGCHGLS